MAGRNSIFDKIIALKLDKLFFRPKSKSEKFSWKDRNRYAIIEKNGDAIVELSLVVKPKSCRRGEMLQLWFSDVSCEMTDQF